MITLKTYLDTRRQKENGSYPVKIRVSQNGKDFLISTGISCLEENWQEGKIGRGEVGYQAKNTQLHNKINIINLLLIDLERKGLSYSNARLKQIIVEELKGGARHSITLLEALDEHMANKTRTNTVKIYGQTRDKIELSGTNTALDEINVTWLTKLEHYMLEEGHSISTIGIHMRNIRAVFNYAIDQEYTKNYPFRRGKYKIKKDKKIKSALNIEKARLFINYECEPHLERYRDYFFLTLFLCGINPIDLVNLKEIKNGRITYKRKKTNQLISIKVEPEAMEIINKYRGKEYLVNINETYADYRSFNSKLNKWLKKFGDVEIVNKKGKKKYTPLFEDISIYTARRSWGTIAGELGVSNEVISQALGHEEIKESTWFYVERNLKLLDEANRKVIDAITKE